MYCNLLKRYIIEKKFPTKNIFEMAAMLFPCNGLMFCCVNVWHKRSPLLAYLVEGMLDFVKDCGLDVKTHLIDI